MEAYPRAEERETLVQYKIRSVGYQVGWWHAWKMEVDYVWNIIDPM
jgi:hypothetical protein